MKSIYTKEDSLLGVWVRSSGHALVALIVVDQYNILSCTFIESHELIGFLLPGMNSYSFFEMQKRHIPSRAMMCISYPLSGDDVHLISPKNKCIG